ncbi:MAG TPA: apolipoprotein N-acyltransferase [Pyrinomonadaceae bacterium]|nr:apolipoprotein N-acyltransferase [Pyrinomonadaceae bacterium]
MLDAAAAQAPNRKLPPESLTRVRASVPTINEASLAIASALLLVLSFPDFDLWWLAWIGLVPLLVAVTLTPKAGRAFLLGWLWGVIFFYGTCWWLTYPMIHYAHLAAPLAYVLLLLPVMLVALFPALFCAVLAHLVSRFGPPALFVAPFLWVSLELGRYAVTGQIWNAIGYSQAFHPMLIQTARWGGVYAVSFLILLSNAAIANLVVRRSLAWPLLSLVILAVIVLASAGTHLGMLEDQRASDRPKVVAVQPNVPMEGPDDPASMQRLLNRHLELSLQGLANPIYGRGGLLLVIWPESPMNFSYARDSQLRDAVATLAQTNHTAVLLNSIEPAPNSGEHNSAILVNQEGQKLAQYDKIRLMPFGEYVPLPQWIPGASSVRGIVGDFTPGSKYTLMPLGDLRAGVFICIEAAHPGIAREFTNEGADVLINISNDGYLGPTPVMRQHLSNAIFRAVENDRDLLRVTNSGISAYIGSSGRVMDSTPGFEPTVRVWTASGKHAGTTFYTRHGDVFAYLCALISLGLTVATFVTRPKRHRNRVSEARP